VLGGVDLYPGKRLIRSDGVEFVFNISELGYPMNLMLVSVAWCGIEHIMYVCVLDYIVCKTTLERNVTLHYHPRVQRLLFVDSKCFRYEFLGCIKQKRGRIKWSSDDIVPNKLRMDGGCTMLKVFEWVDCYKTRQGWVSGIVKMALQAGSRLYLGLQLEPQPTSVNHWTAAARDGIGRSGDSF
jgi:hypothetical protein